MLSIIKIVAALWIKECRISDKVKKKKVNSKINRRCMMKERNMSLMNTRTSKIINSRAVAKMIKD